MPVDARTVVLLTGFGPFPSAPNNATMALVPILGRMARRAFPDIRVAIATLPTEWQAAPRKLDALLEAHQPDIALHFGVSSRARGFEIEARGWNARGQAPDAVGDMPESNAVRDDGPELHRTNLDAYAIVASLRRRGIPAAVSWDAGRYLCNALLYHSLDRARADPTLKRNGFIHLPKSLLGASPVRSRPLSLNAAPGCPLTWDQVLTGSLDIIAVCLGRPVPRRSLKRDVLSKRE